MNVRVVLACLGVRMLLGCTDLSITPDDHVIRELQILAIHADPAEPRLNSPTSVAVLAADPSGEEIPLYAAWRVIFYSSASSASSYASALFFSSPPTVPKISIAPVSERRLPDKGADPSFLVDVFLCTGPMNRPERIGIASEADVTRTLCPDGGFAQGRKSIEIVSRSVTDSRIESFSESVLPQQNPRIAALTVNGEPIAALEDGGGTVHLCDNLSSCPDLRISAALDPASIDYLLDLPDASEAEPDAGGASDAGEPIRLLLESHRIDWYVTGGSLSSPRSFYYPATSEIGEGLAFATASTVWRLPRTEGAAVHTLYAVVRDARGGNSWKRYRFSVGKP